jgi:hypothetical protein
MGNPGTGKSMLQFKILLFLVNPTAYALLTGGLPLPAFCDWTDERGAPVRVPDIVLRVVGYDEVFVYALADRVVHCVQTGGNPKRLLAYFNSLAARHNVRTVVLYEPENEKFKSVPFPMTFSMRLLATLSPVAEDRAK